MSENNTHEEKVPEQEAKKHVEDNPEQNPPKKVEAKAAKSTPPWPLIIVGIFATVMTLAFIVASWMLVASSRQPRHIYGAGRMSPGEQGMNFRHYGMRGGMLQAVAARGVVTAVDGDKLTVSGGGEQVTVKKSSSTDISGDKSSVAVNDTVVVFGSKDTDGTVTATRILVRNSGLEGKSMFDKSIDDSSSTTVPDV